jgi:Tol biopolymer transport system component
MPFLVLLVVAGHAAAADPPRVVAPGILSGPAHDSAPAFTPDGRTVYFTRSGGSVSFIVVARAAAAGGWTTPTVAPFSGQWLDMEPTMAPDGSYLIFVSNRPKAPGQAPVDGAINGKVQPGRGANLWRVDRAPTAAGWSAPVRLPDVVNDSGATYAPSVAANGDLFFMKPDGPKARFRLYQARRTASGYAAPVPLPFSDGTSTDVDPAVAPDESFLVFGSGRHAQSDMDLFLAFRRGDGWTDPIYLGDVINSSPASDAEARLGPDHHTLYFASDRTVPVALPVPPGQADQALGDLATWNNGLYNIWTVDLAPFLKPR